MKRSRMSQVYMTTRASALVSWPDTNSEGRIHVQTEADGRRLGRHVLGNFPRETGPRHISTTRPILFRGSYRP